MQRFVLILICVFSVLTVSAQSTLSGKVLDSLTHKPIPYVNVFFANTTIGTITDTTGFFTIRNIPTGKYDLTFSFVGYTTVQRPIDFSGGNQLVNVYLAEQVIQLKEIYVRADTSNSKFNFKQFKSYFLGSTQNAAHTTIMNPHDVRLYFDQSDRILTGRTKNNKEIEIENRALGYKIYYHLVEFKVDFAQGRMVYLGIPRFEQLVPKGSKERNHWDDERRRAYYGSFSHFIKSLRQNQLEKNGFEVQTLFRMPNSSRPSDTFLNERIRYWRERMMVTGKNDSLSHYYSLRALPKEIDSVGHKISDVTELFLKGSTNQINYKGMLRVTFRNEKEESNYNPSGDFHKVQVSVIYFMGTIKIYDNGYYEDVRDIYLDGYMGWSEKLADLLPLEYNPDAK